MIEVLTNVPQWLETAWPIITTAVTLASLLIKFLPELPEDHWAKSTIKFIGKYVAINRTSNGKVSIVIKD